MSIPVLAVGYLMATGKLNANKSNRSSKGQITYHSIILWFFFGWIVLWLPCIYYFLSDKHKFKLL